MKFNKIIAIGCLITGFTSSIFAAVPGEIEVNRQKRFAESLEAKDNGDLVVIYKKGGPEVTLRKGSYKVIELKLPRNYYSRLDAALRKGNPAEIERIAKDNYNDLKNLDGGIRPGMALAKALEAQKKNDDALALYNTLATTARAARNNDAQAEADLGAAKILQALGRNSDLIKKYPSLLSKGGSAAAFVFNSQGDYAKSQNNDDDALIAYMKTFILLAENDDAAVKKYRADAKKEIIALYEKKGDLTRARNFAREQ